MKKYWYLFLLCFIFLSACIAVPDAIYAALPRVETVEIQPLDTELCVITTGRIEETEKVDIKYDFPIVLKKISVQTGEYVAKGQPVAEVDTSETKKLMISSQNHGYDKLAQVPDFVTATCNSTVSVIGVAEKTVIPENTVLFSMVDPSSLQIRINISEDVISAVRCGQKSVITGSGFKNREYTGTVESISPTAKIQQNGTALQTLVEAVVSITSPDKYLKPGFTAKVKIITKTEKNAIVVPYEAVLQNSDNRQFVYIKKDSTARISYIETSGDCDSGAIIQSGVKKGDLIVLNPSQLSGDAVSVVTIPERSEAK